MSLLICTVKWDHRFGHNYRRREERNGGSSGFKPSLGYQMCPKAAPMTGSSDYAEAIFDPFTTADSTVCLEHSFAPALGVFPTSFAANRGGNRFFHRSLPLVAAIDSHSPVFVRLQLGTFAKCSFARLKLRRVLGTFTNLAMFG